MLSILRRSAGISWRPLEPVSAAVAEPVAVAEVAAVGRQPLGAWVAAEGLPASAATEAVAEPA